MKSFKVEITQTSSVTVFAKNSEEAKKAAIKLIRDKIIYDNETNIDVTGVREIEQKQTLFRCDEDTKKPIMAPLDVISFEVFELGNTDILDYCLTHYLDSKISKYPQFGHTYDIISAINDDDEVHSYWRDQYDNNFETDSNPIKDFILFLETVLKTKINFVLWLAEKTSVETLYMNSSCTVYEYKTSDVVLSDLGFDGKLFAYKDRPEFIKQ